MIKYSVFDILGPIMIGPSSSHTAGANKIGKAIYVLSKGNLKKINFFVHGSFADTCKGHGTDKALLAGALGINADDENIKNSFNIAAEKGVEFCFDKINLTNVHPNTVLIEAITNKDEKISLMASSIGGGNISITSINGKSCELSGVYPSLIITHYDKLGMISVITKEIANQQINLVSLKSEIIVKGELANTIIELESEQNIDLKKISEIKNILDVQFINKL